MPVARMACAQVSASGPPHEETCEFPDASEQDHTHGRACIEASRGRGPLCGLQQQRQRVLRHHHMHATPRPVCSQSHTWVPSPSGLASDGCSRASGSLCTMHAQTQSLGGSARQATDAQTMACMRCNGPTASGSSLQASGARGHPATQLHPSDCMDMLDQPIQ